MLAVKLIVGRKKVGREIKNRKRKKWLEVKKNVGSKKKIESVKNRLQK